MKQILKAYVVSVICSAFVATFCMLCQFAILQIAIISKNSTPMGTSEMALALCISFFSFCVSFGILFLLSLVPMAYWAKTSKRSLYALAGLTVGILQYVSALNYMNILDKYNLIILLVFAASGIIGAVKFWKYSQAHLLCTLSNGETK